MLMKRFYLIEKSKDADIIGILVGTLSVSKYLDMIDHLKDIITKAGKRYYMFVVGKLNVPKLANFQEIEMFVIVACPENSLIDSKDLYIPVVTPHELEIALVRFVSASELLESRRDKSLCLFLLIVLLNVNMY
jgi:diphthamide biosynthesis protein 2